MTTNIDFKDEPGMGEGFIEKHNEMGRQLDAVREVLDPETMNSVRVILESVQSARASYKGSGDVGKGIIKFQLKDIEVFFAKMAAVEEILKK